MRKAAKAERGGGVTSQPPRGATNTQRLREAQSHKGVEQQANSQSRPRGGPQLISRTEDSIQNWTASPCWGRSWLNRAADEGQCSCCLVETIVLTTLHKLAVSPHLIIPANLVDKRTKYYSQDSYLVRPHWSFHLYTNTRIGHLRNNSRTYIKRQLFVIPEPGVFYWVFFSFSSIINSIITIFLSLFLPP
jgi:hypothetical protein